MGKLESENRKIIRRTLMQEAILLTIASGGRRGTDRIVAQVIARLTNQDYTPPLRKNEVVRTAASRLRKKGLLRFEDNHYALTTLGENVLEHWKRSDFKLERPRKWDKKWRIIIFDIPEKKRGIRNEVGGIFKKAGLKRLQDSVWVYPYDCEDVVGLLKTDFGIGRDLLYIIADQIENDKYLREEFGLLP